MAMVYNLLFLGLKELNKPMKSFIFTIFLTSLLSLNQAAMGSNGSKNKCKVSFSEFKMLELEAEEYRSIQLNIEKMSQIYKQLDTLILETELNEGSREITKLKLKRLKLAIEAQKKSLEDFEVIEKALITRPLESKELDYIESLFKEEKD